MVQGSGWEYPVSHRDSRRLRATPHSAKTTIVNVGYMSTNYWVVSAGTSRLLVDLGFRGTMGTMRANLRRMNVPIGEIRYGLATHSDESVSLVLDDGSAFTGDLTHPALIAEEPANVVSASWQLLRERGANRVYPGHGPVRPMHAEVA